MSLLLSRLSDLAWVGPLLSSGLLSVVLTRCWIWRERERRQTAVDLERERRATACALERERRKTLITNTSLGTEPDRQAENADARAEPTPR